MRCRRTSLRSFRLVAATLAGGLVLAACSSGSDPSPPDETAASPTPETAEPDATDPEEPPPSEPTDEGLAAAAYTSFLEALATAMEVGDVDLPELAATASGPGLVNAQLLVVSLTEAGRIARGAYVPSIESIEVDGDTATIEDCYRVEMVQFDRDSDEQVADRGGARFQASAELERSPDGGWIVTVFSEGEPCAPASVATAVTDRYLAFWDAVWDAADPPNPEHPGLIDTAAGDYLAVLQAQLTQLRDDGHVRRGRGIENPEVVFVTANDTQAFVRDCVEENPDGGVYDATSGELLDDDPAPTPGQRTLLESRLELLDGDWRVTSVNVKEEDRGCEPGGS